jgi:hypothetical protein
VRLLIVATRARPRVKLTVAIEEGAKDLRNERSRVHGLSMDVLIVSRVTVEAGIQVATEHDADLNGAKGLGDACEFHLVLRNR